MCGLFGAVGTALNKKDVEAVKELGFLSALRGMDSTGVGFAFRKMGKKERNTTYFSWMKSIDHSVDFLWAGDFDRIVAQHKDTLCVMGHTRAATCGSVKKDNAHPFHAAHIIGAQNGCVPKYRLEAKDGDKTDSELLIRSIAAKGLLEALDLAGHSAEYAVSYLDSHHNELVLVRNDKRPLAYCFTEDKKKLFWASDGMFLELVRARFQDSIQMGDIVNLPAGYKLTWMFGNAKYKLEDIKPEVPEFKGWGDFWARRNNYATQEKVTEQNSVFKSQEEIELARSRALPMLPTSRKAEDDDPTAVLAVDHSKKLDPPAINVKNLNVSEGSVEFPFRVFNGRSPPSFGYPPLVILNGFRKVLRYTDWYGQFVGRDKLYQLTANGCMISGKHPLMSEKVWWLHYNQFVMDDYIDDQLVKDHIKCNGIVPRRGQPIYIGTRLLLDAHNNKEAGVERMHQIKEQLHNPDQLWFDPAFDWKDEDEEGVSCH